MEDGYLRGTDSNIPSWFGSRINASLAPTARGRTAKLRMFAIKLKYSWNLLKRSQAGFVIRENKDGNFQVKFTPKISGSYTIDAKLNAVTLAGSLFRVQVQERRFCGDLVTELHMSREGRVKLLRGIAVNRKGKIAVTDYEGHCVAFFSDNADGFISKLGSEGESDGHFKHPADVTFLTDNEILVADE